MKKSKCFAFRVSKWGIWNFIRGLPFYFFLEKLYWKSMWSLLYFCFTKMIFLNGNFPIKNFLGHFIFLSHLLSQPFLAEKLHLVFFKCFVVLKSLDTTVRADQDISLATVQMMALFQAWWFLFFKGLKLNTFFMLAFMQSVNY